MRAGTIVSVGDYRRRYLTMRYGDERAWRKDRVRIRVRIRIRIREYEEAKGIHGVRGAGGQVRCMYQMMTR